MRQVMPAASRPSAGGGSFAAPVGGWNARDPIANMPVSDAIFLDNFFPRTSDVQLRPGSAVFATLPADTMPGSPHNVRSLLSYSSPAGVKKLFAACEDGIYDITTGGTISSIASAATNNQWQSVNISTAGGSFLWCCNGVDKSRYFDGSAWTVLDGSSSPALTGITSTDITNVSLFKSRLIFCLKNSLSFFYLPVNSVAGAAVEFPLGALFTRGGYLMATASWTLDGGNGPDDYFVTITSEGEIALYQGTDPSNASAWALKGIYYIGAPLSRRCMMRLGGDLAILTVTGLYPLSKALQSATVDKRSAVSDKISKAWVDYTSNFKTLSGWQAVLYPNATFALVNVPIAQDSYSLTSYSYQFVMNTQTGAWCRFVGMPSEVWAVHDGKLYFALNNVVSQAWTGQSDSSGFPIEGRIKTAFQYPAGRGAQARITLIRPIFTTSSQNMQAQLGLDTDYEEAYLPGSSISYATTVATWDQSKWGQAVWTGSDTSAKWRSVAHRPGRAVSVRLRVLGKGINMSWNALDYVLQRGGLL